MNFNDLDPNEKLANFQNAAKSTKVFDPSTAMGRGVAIAGLSIAAISFVQSIDRLTKSHDNDGRVDLAEAKAYLGTMSSSAGLGRAGLKLLSSKLAMLQNWLPGARLQIRPWLLFLCLRPSGHRLKHAMLI